jgi:cell fate (sporulation/competence/biofilm development) regulator YlbF (YheA/YmcA/DUF963 family)
MVYDKANELANEIRASGEYKAYEAAKAKIAPGSSAAALLGEYRKLEYRAQAAMVAGEEDPETLEKLRTLGELLQSDADASEYLIAEFRLSRLVGDVYRMIAKAAGLDVSMLD